MLNYLNKCTPYEGRNGNTQFRAGNSLCTCHAAQRGLLASLMILPIARVFSRKPLPPFRIFSVITHVRIRADAKYRNYRRGQELFLLGEATSARSPSLQFRMYCRSLDASRVLNTSFGFKPNIIYIPAFTFRRKKVIFCLAIAGGYRHLHLRRI